MKGLVIDNFAGGGGASTALEQGLGRHVDIAINHDPEAIRMHKRNHPDTEHYCESVWDVDPASACRGRPVDVAWFSPDCKHFSRAKGGALKDRNIRALAWIVMKWASLPEWQRPRVIFLENVIEFLTWSPVRADGEIDRRYRKGFTFNRWVGRLRKAGYDVEWRELRADQYGAPTIRKRLFLVARCDSRPIAWPQPTHADPRNRPSRSLFADADQPDLKPWRTAADIIDWSIPCPSIFDRARPLAERTQNRIAAGLKKYVIDHPSPFIVKVNHAYDQFRGQGLDEPLQTMTSKLGSALVTPYVTYGQHGGRNRDVTYPLHTVTASKKDTNMIVTPIIDRQFGTSTGASVDEPLGTVMTQGAGKSALVTPTLIQTGYGERPGQNPRILDKDKPLGTVVAGGNKFAVAAAHVTKFQQNGQGQDAREPLHTVMAGAPRFGAVAAYIAQHNTGRVGRDADAPLSTVMQRGSQQQPVEVMLSDPEQMDERAEQVRAFLIKYYGTGVARDLRAPLGAVTTKDRFGLITVRGETFRIVDIGMRMLTPRELFNAQGFPEDYDILEGETSKSNQVARAGNAVSPPPARALIKTNVPASLEAEWVEDRKAWEIAA